MDTSLSLQLQQAWLHTQLNKRSPPRSSSIASAAPSMADLPPFFSPSSSRPPSDLDPSSPDPWSSSRSSSGASDLWLPSQPQLSVPWSSSSAEIPASLPSKPDISSIDPSSLDISGMDAPGFDGDGDTLMDPVLDYISDMLMEEQWEDRKCMRQECIAYQAIVNGFYEILGEDSSSHSSGTERSPSPAAEEVGGDDYSWIDDVLISDPKQEASVLSSPWAFDSSGSSSESDVKPQLSSQWSFDSSSGTSSYSPGSPLYPPVVHDNGLVALPKVASAVSSTQQSYSTASQTNGGTSAQTNGYANSLLHTMSTQSYSTAAQTNGSLLHNPGLRDLQDILFSNGVFPGFQPETTLQFESEDVKFRRVKSEELHQGNASLFHVNGNLNDNGGYKRASSDKFSDKLGQFQEFEKQRQDFQPSLINGVGKVSSSSLSSDDRISFVRNENLNAEKAAKMYGEWSLTADGKGGCRTKKPEVLTNGKRSAKADAVDLRSLLVSCAQAVAGNDLRKANEILQEIRQHASPHGSVAQRLAHYFAEGLVARLSGTGGRLYTVMSNNRPSAAKMLKANRVMVQICPYTKLSHYFANQSILKVAEGASRLHIVDYGILYGFQWPCLISALAERKGGPPSLRITGIEFPLPGLNSTEGVEETGRRLAEYARTYGVPFEYHAIANKWEDVQPAHLHLKQGEVLVVNCIYRLRHLMDETVVASSPRRKVLSRMRSLNPDILLTGVMNAGFNAPFFVSRFREALYHYSSKFDMIDTTVDSDNQERLMLEREVLGRDILNVVACEGPERVERPETYRQWQSRIQRAGFEQLPLQSRTLTKARAVVKGCYHKDYGVDEDGKWMLLGWKGRIMQALSAWKPSSVDAGK